MEFNDNFTWTEESYTCDITLLDCDYEHEQQTIKNGE